VKQKCELPGELGCNFTDHGRIEVDIFQKTNVPGIYAAGDNYSLGRAVSIAVSAGSVAGMMLNKELIEEEFEKVG
jgi:pyruvate/2-oxoglutarate dehydrogenase complex dihydrolipoamide dehydrogenase (E3) component